jgi:Cdc6-like AAA superfamily ATPase
VRPQQNRQQKSSATETSDAGFVETSEHRKFVEFGDACKAYRYIGLCYGPPGVGKTLSARRYSRADSLAGYDRWNDATMPPIMFDTVLYTAEVVNTPSRVALDLGRAREKLTSIAANRAASPYCARNDQAS